MKFIPIKNLIRGYQNRYVYNDLIHAKEKLFHLNIQIEKKQREINQLEAIYENNKKKATLAVLFDTEIFVVINKKIENSVCYLLDKFNDKLISELEKGNLVFNLYCENPTDIDIEALKFLEMRLNEENFEIKLGDKEIKNNLQPHSSIVMYVKVINYSEKSKKAIKIKYE